MNYNKILVTGSSGFIGSHVADILEEIGKLDMDDVRHQVDEAQQAGESDSEK